MKGGVGVYIPLYITWLQIAVEWLHDCCHLVLPCALIHAGLPRDAAKRIVWLQECCMGLVLGRKPEHVKWLQAALKGTLCVRRLRLQSFHCRIGSPLVFCISGCSMLLMRA